MGAKMVTVTRGKKKAKVVESAVPVWEKRGWSVEGSKESTQQSETPPPPATKNPDRGKTE